ncbi:MAG: D-2-hydroxyacid dehydrogenase [Bacteroidales bacterium]|nr:D-2-hydroxyacid dehydrogenase [Bacteroidales bacterium]
MNIIFLDRATIDLDDINFSSIKACGHFVSYPNSTGEEIILRSRNADIIISNKAPITQEVMEACKNLRLITVIATGYNNVDIDSAKKRGITVCNVAGYAKNTVPQHTFSLILNLATKVYKYYHDVKSGDWQNATMFTLLKYPTFELYGKTLGIIGFGVIGQAVARIATGFGMKVIYYDSYVPENNIYDSADLKTLLKVSDIVTIHCPLNKETLNLIGKDELSVMKPSALLINTARGGIVNETALAEALNKQVIAGAGIDVLSEEPPVKGNALLSAKNCIITPHSAWSTIEARQTLVDETARNIMAFLNGEKRNVVN